MKVPGATLLPLHRSQFSPSRPASQSSGISPTSRSDISIHKGSRVAPTDGWRPSALSSCPTVLPDGQTRSELLYPTTLLCTPCAPGPPQTVGSAMLAPRTSYVSFLDRSSVEPSYATHQGGRLPHLPNRHPLSSLCCSRPRLVALVCSALRESRSRSDGIVCSMSCRILPEPGMHLRSSDTSVRHVLSGIPEVFGPTTHRVTSCPIRLHHYLLCCPRPPRPPPSAMCSMLYGSNAMCRARLIAFVTWRWCFAQLPVRPGLRIFPVSPMKRESIRTSL